MGSSAADWEALDAMFTSHPDEVSAPPSSYGRDAPVKVVGPSPGMIGPPKKAPAAKKAAKKPIDPNEIWNESEILDAGDVDDVDDGRRQPEYDMIFKQNVTPEDYFLGVDPLRHGGIACSDELVLKVTLPETKLTDIDLDVRPTFVRLGAPKYKLKVQLPEKVDDARGNAKWDAATAVLTVTLPIVGDFDAKLVTTSASNELD
jgi:HSP20 family molecular chaperone IbpA